MNYRGFETLVSGSQRIIPFFSREIRRRVKHKLFTNVAITGQAGISKSYIAITLARICEGLTASGKDRFKVKQVVFQQSEYLYLLPRLKMGKPIVFDEPSYALGKRDWYKDLQKVLVHTLESQRFLVHPVFIPIINLALLDKTIRAYLISHVVHVVGRGHGRVYEIKPSQRTEKVYWYQMGDIYYRMFDQDECTLDSCLGCNKFSSCQVFRAQYERKKRDIQMERYNQAKDQALAKESQELTEQQIINLIIPQVKNLLSEKTGRLAVGKVRNFLRKQQIKLSVWKSRQIKESIEAEYPDLFEEAA